MPNIEIWVKENDGSNKLVTAEVWLGDTEAFKELVSVYNIDRETAGDIVIRARMSAKYNKIEDPVCYISADTPGYLSKPISRKTAELNNSIVKGEYFSI